MLVTFTSNVDADVLMMGDHAELVLRTAGKDVTHGVPERGVFSYEQLDESINRLEAAVAAEPPPKMSLDEDDYRDDHEKSKAAVVLLAQRTYPLLAMLKKARDAKTSVMWETSSGW
jgi:pyrimidine operon attenuation protein/uracil phosphoribosyltransferase